jgi:hydrogenase maturation protease
MNPKVTLIGLGNMLMRDEGVGIHAVHYIEKNFTIPPDLQVIDGGTSGLDLLPFIENRECVIFVDAVNFNREPGYIGVLTNEQIPALFGVKDSLHHMGLMDVLAAAQLLDRLPKEICLIGIQPESIETGLELSESITAKFPSFIPGIISQIRFRGVAIQAVRP